MQEICSSTKTEWNLFSPWSTLLFKTFHHLGTWVWLDISLHMKTEFSSEICSCSGQELLLDDFLNDRIFKQVVLFYQCEAGLLFN